jgi:hypothetical protein
VSVGVVGRTATLVTPGSWVLITDVLVGPALVGRGVTVGWGVISALPGVFVGAFPGAAITTTSSVGMLARFAGVGLRLLWVARSAAAALAASGAIGGSCSWIFHGL